MSESVLPMFSSRSFMVSGLSVRLLLILLYFATLHYKTNSPVKVASLPPGLPS